MQSPQPGRGFVRERTPPGGNDDNSEVIMIDSNLVGLVIGRQGENLRRIEQESGTRIQFITPADHPGPQRQCRISGKPRAREDAKQEIYRIMDENQEKMSGRDGSRGAGGNRQQSARSNTTVPVQPVLREGENSSQIMVPDRTVGLIIGRGGETIRDLQERSGCHINIVGPNKTVNALRPVNLIGTLEASNRAKDLIMEIVESDTRGGQSGDAPQAGGHGGGQYPPQAPDHGGGGGKVTESIQVPSEAVGMIIGKGPQPLPHTYFVHITDFARG
jgi:far upstream element-binding protein